MNNSEWCVIFAINDKVQNFTTFSDLDRLYHSKTDESIINSWD